MTEREELIQALRMASDSMRIVADNMKFHGRQPSERQMVLWVTALYARSDLSRATLTKLAPGEPLTERVLTREDVAWPSPDDRGAEDTLPELEPRKGLLEAGLRAMVAAFAPWRAQTIKQELALAQAKAALSDSASCASTTDGDAGPGKDG